MTTRRLLDTTTTAALRQLDPAGRSPEGRPLPLTPAERDRADATLQRIVSADAATGPAAAHASSNSPHRSRRAAAAAAASRAPRRTRQRLLLGLGATAVAAALAVPGLVPGQDVAYASWTPLPAPLSTAASAAAVNACLTAHHQAGPASAEPLIAERRGGWTYVLIPLTKNEEASCIMPTDALRPGQPLRDGQWFGGSGDHPPLKPSPRHLYQLVAGVGGTNEGLLSYTEGEVGRDVVGVTITTPRGVNVVASVDNGRYAAWWPAGKDRITNPEISEAALFELTLRDGTTSREPPR